MKAHRVKCQLCAHGVTVVRAEPIEDSGLIGEPGNGSLTEVFAGALDNNEAIEKMATVVAEQETEARNAMLEEGEEPDELTAGDIRKTWTFNVQSMAIRP